MKKGIKFTSIKHKMMFGFSLIIILVVILGIYNFIATQSTNDDVNRIAHEEVPLVIANEGLVTTLADRIAIAYGYVLFGDSSYKDRFQQSNEEALQFEETSATTQQASGSMEEVAASSNDLAKLAEELNELIQQFKV